MASKSIISLSMLPVEDIANYLEIVKGHAVKSEKASDTEFVDGVESGKIAIAALDNDGNLVSDRSTVTNALNLGGIAAEQYLTVDKSGSLLQDTYEVSATVSDGLKAVRDELYQLKAELAKQGYIKQGAVYDGFYDAFRNGEIRYIDEPVSTIASAINASVVNVPVQNQDAFRIGEFIGVKDNTGAMHARRIIDISNGFLLLNDSFGVNVDAGAEIFKYAGSYHNGEFIFGKDNGSYISGDTVKAIVKDGKERTEVQSLGDVTKGFATKLSNYYSTYGSFVRKVEFSLAYTGNPGNIRASIWKVIEETELSPQSYECIGVSNSVYPSSCSSVLTNVEFEFDEPIEIVRGTDYLIALYCGGAGGSNTWKIGGYVDEYYGLDSLWFTDDTFLFDGEGQFEVIPGSTDAYLALSISSHVQADIAYGNSGLYSCKEEIKNGFSRVRVELKVNREGIFAVSSDAALATNAGHTLKLAGESRNPFDRDDKVVVGNMFSKIVENTTAASIQMADDMYTPVGADVYRMGYTVIAKCKRKVSDVPLAYDDEVLIELPLVAVMSGKEAGKEASSSDRLIFESVIATEDKSNALKIFHDLEIQVHWASSMTAESINDAPQFAGKILDISVSTDKSYSKVEGE